MDLTVDAKDLVGSVIHNAELLAAIYGKQARAREKIDALRASIAALHGKAGAAHRPDRDDGRQDERLWRARASA